jgi:hypothetical protein
LLSFVFQCSAEQRADHFDITMFRISILMSMPTFHGLVFFHLNSLKSRWLQADISPLRA